MGESSSQQAFVKRNRSALKPQAKKHQSQTHARTTDELGVCIYWPVSGHWLISYSLIHLT